MDKKLNNYLQETEQELRHILQYWMQYSIDEKYGGFYGRISEDNKPDITAAKGSVLNSRILYAFSAAYLATKERQYLRLADRAYEYFVNHFIDKKYGGVYWTVDHTGRALDDKKQVYALAFAIYGLSEYYKINRLDSAMQYAMDIYAQIENHSFDKNQGGYYEAFSREWLPLADLRLSEKDANEKKTMNTHLHIVEAYTNLYCSWPDVALKENISRLLHDFKDRIIDPETFHLRLFFDENWDSKSDIISYGHDIEASWLLLEAAQVINNADLVKEFKELSVKMANAASRGLDNDGGLWYEFDPSHHQLSKEKHWWPQAEAMVGYLNAWLLTCDQLMLARSLESWQFIKKYILDKKNGEWHWGVNHDNSVMQNREKAGIWKCPYHNSRACLEVIKRINNWESENRDDPE